MNRSDRILKIAALAVFAAVVCYIGYYIYNALANPFDTYTAASFSVTESGESAGWAVRSEEVIHASGLVSVEAGEGLRVGSGQVIALEYQDETALERGDEIYELKLEIAQLESRLEAGDDVSADALESVLGLSRALASPCLAGLDSALLDAKSSVFGESEAYDVSSLRAELAEKQTRLKTLQEMQRGVTEITADETGLFTSTVDGFEFVSPDALVEISAGALEVLFSQPEQELSVIGKLISGTTWYYAAIMSEADAARLTSGGKATLSFSKTYSDTIVMTVDSITRSGDGRSVVIFSSTRYMADTCSLRELYAQVVFRVVEGLRVPKEALHLDPDGTTYVYLISGIQAKRVNVTLLAESGAYYVLAETSSLFEGAEVITKCRNLYNGKVVG